MNMTLLQMFPDLHIGAHVLCSTGIGVTTC